MKLSQLAGICDGKLVGQDKEFSAVSTDTRSLQRGALFIALRGPNYDGHSFVHQAIERGAVALLLENDIDMNELSVKNCSYIIVDDSRIALGQLAAVWRQNNENLFVIGVTGSNGKTTVKEMLAAILAQQQPTLATKGNLNNEIGVPLTLLNINNTHRYAIIEMGANHIGEIEYLTHITQPDVALVTNVGPAHLEGFGSLDGVAKAKAEIYLGLKEQGIAIINADDAYAQQWHEMNQHHRLMSFSLGQHQSANVFAVLQADVLELTYQGQSVQITMPLLGEHNARNVLAATTAALAADIDLKTIKSGIESIKAVSGRLDIFTGVNGIRIIDDTYNANPASFKAAFEVLKNFSGQHWLIMGAMGELGDQSIAFHREIGLQAKQYGIDRLFAIGSMAKNTVAAFGDGALYFNQKQDLFFALSKYLQDNVTALVKGSRLMHMEDIVQKLRSENYFNHQYAFGE